MLIDAATSHKPPVVRRDPFRCKIGVRNCNPKRSAHRFGLIKCGGFLNPLQKLQRTDDENVRRPAPCTRALPQSGTPAALFAGLHVDQMIYVGIGVAPILFGIWWIRRFLKADADLHLLSCPPPEKDFFDGKVVWITGASQGFGKKLAQYFSKHGAKLILSSRKKEQLEKAASSCQGKFRGETVILPFDLTAGPVALADVAKIALSSFDNAGPDYIIHNAGASQHGLAHEASPKIVDQMFQLNTVGPITLTTALLPGLLEKGKGHFVAIASMGAMTPAPGQALYSGCKFGLRGYFLALRSEMADSPLRFSVCCPGPLASSPDGSDPPRVVFGSNGLISEKIETGAGGKRLEPDRAIELIATAMRNNLAECWIAKHPVLFIGYLFQFFPSLGWWLMERYGPSRARQMKTGEGYSMKKLLFGKKNKAL
ncbi:hypothetical protein BSKO_01436 [Bryopsis sp. KO-2023]|nr:hypothetical protein BSKO_01436 [Bryopsis sp. KO-2023]